MRISDWSSDVFSSDLAWAVHQRYLPGKDPFGPERISHRLLYLREKILRWENACVCRQGIIRKTGGIGGQRIIDRITRKSVSRQALEGSFREGLRSVYCKRRKGYCNCSNRN